MLNNSSFPLYHLRRIGPAATKLGVADIMDFSKVVSLIGRNQTQVDFVLDSSLPASSLYISRLHARVVRQGDNLHRLFDDSLNGIFINNTKISGSVILQEGDIVTFGHPHGVRLAAGVWKRQPDSEHQFIFERCNCKGLSKAPVLGDRVNIETDGNKGAEKLKTSHLNESIMATNSEVMFAPTLVHPESTPLQHSTHSHGKTTDHQVEDTSLMTTSQESSTDGRSQRHMPDCFHSPSVKKQSADQSCLEKTILAEVTSADLSIQETMNCENSSACDKLNCSSDKQLSFLPMSEGSSCFTSETLASDVQTDANFTSKHFSTETDDQGLSILTLVSKSENVHNLTNEKERPQIESLNEGENIDPIFKERHKSVASSSIREAYGESVSENSHGDHLRATTDSLVLTDWSLSSVMDSNVMPYSLKHSTLINNDIPTASLPFMPQKRDPTSSIAAEIVKGVCDDFSDTDDEKSESLPLLNRLASQCSIGDIDSHEEAGREEKPLENETIITGRDSKYSKQSTCSDGHKFPQELSPEAGKENENNFCHGDIRMNPNEKTETEVKDVGAVIGRERKQEAEVYSQEKASDQKENFQAGLNLFSGERGNDRSAVEIKWKEVEVTETCLDRIDHTSLSTSESEVRVLYDLLRGSETSTFFNVNRNQLFSTTDFDQNIGVNRVETVDQSDMDSCEIVNSEKLGQTISTLISTGAKSPEQNKCDSQSTTTVANSETNSLTVNSKTSGHTEPADSVQTAVDTARDCPTKNILNCTTGTKERDKHSPELTEIQNIGALTTGELDRNSLPAKSQILKSNFEAELRGIKPVVEIGSDDENNRKITVVSSNSADSSQDRVIVQINLDKEDIRDEKEARPANLTTREEKHTEASGSTFRLSDRNVTSGNMNTEESLPSVHQDMNRTADPETCIDLFSVQSNKDPITGQHITSLGASFGSIEQKHQITDKVLKLETSVKPGNGIMLEARETSKTFTTELETHETLRDIITMTEEKESHFCPYNEDNEFDTNYDDDLPPEVPAVVRQECVALSSENEFENMAGKVGNTTDKEWTEKAGQVNKLEKVLSEMYQNQRNAPKNKVLNQARHLEKELPDKVLSQDDSAEKELPEKTLNQDDSAEEELPDKTLNQDDSAEKELPEMALNQDDSAEKELPDKALKQDDSAEKELPDKALKQDDHAEKELPDKALKQDGSAEKELPEKVVKQDINTEKELSTGHPENVPVEFAFNQHLNNSKCDLQKTAVVESMENVPPDINVLPGVTVDNVNEIETKQTKCIVDQTAECSDNKQLDCIAVDGTMDCTEKEFLTGTMNQAAIKMGNEQINQVVDSTENEKAEIAINQIVTSTGNDVSKSECAIIQVISSKESEENELPPSEFAINQFPIIMENELSEVCMNLNNNGAGSEATNIDILHTAVSVGSDHPQEARFSESDCATSVHRTSFEDQQSPGADCAAIPSLHITCPASLNPDFSVDNDITDTDITCSDADKFSKDISITDSDSVSNNETRPIDRKEETNSNNENISNIADKNNTKLARPNETQSIGDHFKDVNVTDAVGINLERDVFTSHQGSVSKSDITEDGSKVMDVDVKINKTSANTHDVLCSSEEKQVAESRSNNTRFLEKKHEGNDETVLSEKDSRKTDVPTGRCINYICGNDEEKDCSLCDCNSVSSKDNMTSVTVTKEHFGRTHFSEDCSFQRVASSLPDAIETERAPESVTLTGQTRNMGDIISGAKSMSWIDRYNLKGHDDFFTERTVYFETHFQSNETSEAWEEGHKDTDPDKINLNTGKNKEMFLRSLGLKMETRPDESERHLNSTTSLKQVQTQPFSSTPVEGESCQVDCNLDRTFVSPINMEEENCRETENKNEITIVKKKNVVQSCLVTDENLKEQNAVQSCVVTENLKEQNAVQSCLVTDENLKEQNVVQSCVVTDNLKEQNAVQSCVVTDNLKEQNVVQSCVVTDNLKEQNAVQSCVVTDNLKEQNAVQSCVVTDNLKEQNVVQSCVVTDNLKEQNAVQSCVVTDNLKEQNAVKSCVVTDNLKEQNAVQSCLVTDENLKDQNAVQSEIVTEEDLKSEEENLPTVTRPAPDVEVLQCRCADKSLTCNESQTSTALASRVCVPVLREETNIAEEDNLIVKKEESNKFNPETVAMERAHNINLSTFMVSSSLSMENVINLNVLGGTEAAMEPSSRAALKVKAQGEPDETFSQLATIGNNGTKVESSSDGSRHEATIHSVKQDSVLRGLENDSLNPRETDTCKQSSIEFTTNVKESILSVVQSINTETASHISSVENNYINTADSSAGVNCTSVDAEEVTSSSGEKLSQVCKGTSQTPLLSDSNSELASQVCVSTFEESLPQKENSINAFLTNNYLTNATAFVNHESPQLELSGLQEDTDTINKNSSPKNTLVKPILSGHKRCVLSKTKECVQESQSENVNVSDNETYTLKMKATKGGQIKNIFAQMPTEKEEIHVQGNSLSWHCDDGMERSEKEEDGMDERIKEDILSDELKQEFFEKLGLQIRVRETINWTKFPTELPVTNNAEMKSHTAITFSESSLKNVSLRHDISDNQNDNDKGFPKSITSDSTYVDIRSHSGFTNRSLQVLHNENHSELEYDQNLVMSSEPRNENDCNEFPFKHPVLPLSGPDGSSVDVEEKNKSGSSASGAMFDGLEASPISSTTSQLSDFKEEEDLHLVWSQAESSSHDKSSSDVDSCGGIVEGDTLFQNNEDENNEKSPLPAFEEDKFENSGRNEDESSIWIACLDPDLPLYTFGGQGSKKEKKRGEGAVMNRCNVDYCSISLTTSDTPVVQETVTCADKAHSFEHSEPETATNLSNNIRNDDTNQNSGQMLSDYRAGQNLCTGTSIISTDAAIAAGQPSQEVGNGKDLSISPAENKVKFLEGLESDKSNSKSKIAATTGPYKNKRKSEENLEHPKHPSKKCKLHKGQSAHLCSANCFLTDKTSSTSERKCDVLHTKEKIVLDKNEIKIVYSSDKAVESIYTDVQDFQVEERHAQEITHLSSVLLSTTEKELMDDHFDKKEKFRDPVSSTNCSIGTDRESPVVKQEKHLDGVAHEESLDIPETSCLNVEADQPRNSNKNEELKWDEENDVKSSLPRTSGTKGDNNFKVGEVLNKKRHVAEYKYFQDFSCTQKSNDGIKSLLSTEPNSGQVKDSVEVFMDVNRAENVKLFSEASRKRSWNTASDYEHINALPSSQDKKSRVCSEHSPGKKCKNNNGQKVATTIISSLEPSQVCRMSACSVPFTKESDLNDRCEEIRSSLNEDDENGMQATLLSHASLHDKSSIAELEVPQRLEDCSILEASCSHTLVNGPAVKAVDPLSCTGETSDSLNVSDNRKERRKKLQEALLNELVQLNNTIQQTLSLNNPNVDNAVCALEDLDALPINATLLLSYPAVLETIRKCQKYRYSEEVCKLAQRIYNRFRALVNCT